MAPKFIGAHKLVSIRLQVVALTDEESLGQAYSQKDRLHSSDKGFYSTHLFVQEDGGFSRFPNVPCFLSAMLIIWVQKMFRHLQFLHILLCYRLNLKQIQLILLLLVFTIVFEIISNDNAKMFLEM